MSDTKMLDNPAFPFQKEDGSPYWGMTLRDYFAGKALAANGDNDDDPRVTARDCYKLADAMLRERAK